MAERQSPSSRAAAEGRVEHDDHPAGGMRAVLGGLKHLLRQRRSPRTALSLFKINQQKGFDCPGCAWPEPGKPSTFEFCEQGMKHLAWEASGKRADPAFFRSHTVTELRAWSDRALEDQGRLTHPMRYDPETDRYEPVEWETAFARIAETLNGLASPDEAILYTSGRTSNEAAFLYQLMSRLYGTNNLPDCSNMCHESSGVALGEQIGIGKGTVRLSDFEEADAILILGQNPGSNHPRMLTSLQRAKEAGCTIVAFNPLRERGLERFSHPQRPWQTLTGASTRISDLYMQPKVGGDLAAMKGMIKHVLAAEAARPGEVLDRAFIDAHTTGFEALEADVEATGWSEIEAGSGLSRRELEQAAEIFIRSRRTIACWAMGLTQHKHAVPMIQMVVNLLLTRGQIGLPGAGACPVRGHSNVQGDRTVGITEQPGAGFLDALGSAFGFEPPREHGHDTVHAIEAMHAGRARCFIGMGGNFATATPDFAYTAEALESCDLTVQISTKLNRSHLVHGKEALILPCLTRNERDEQATGPQRVTVEDSMSQVHASGGDNPPVSPHLRSEPAIVAGIAKALFAGTDRERVVDWDALVADYGRIRDKIAEVMPSPFAGYNERIEAPGGFYLGNSARDRNWQTPEGRARFFAHPIPDLELPGEQLWLTTVRSHDQFNTTVYGDNDRYRGVYGTRRVVFANQADLADRGLADGDAVRITSHFGGADGGRRVDNFRAVAYDLPRGCVAGYFPELNPLAAADVYADRSNTPTTKAIPVTIEPAG